MKQDNKYIVIKSSNSDKEYEIVLFNSNSRLSENQKINLLITVNKFYLEIQSMKKKYLLEL